MRCSIKCADASEYAGHIPDNTVDLYILDPPFGIGEKSFSGAKNGGIYKDNVIPGYQEAPEDYATFVKCWLSEVYRTVKPTGTVYVIIGWSYPLADVMIAARELGFHLLNHIIWHYNTQVVPTQKKWSSSHYHILRLGKKKEGQTFHLPDDEDIATWCSMPAERKGNLSTYDKMDVWCIPKTKGNGVTNLNKLPDALVRKMILYSSNPDDLVVDLFMGNFTTAYIALQEERRVMGCDVNINTVTYHSNIINDKYNTTSQ